MAADNDKKTLDYGTFLADLEAKRAALDQAIGSLRAVMASGALAINASDSMAGMADNVSVALHGGEVPAGAFLAKSIPEATKLYLSIVKRKQTPREIAEALRKGGMETTSKNFEGIVAAGIHRASKKDGEIVKVGRAWALASWYPSGIRAAAAKETRKARKAKKSRKQKSVKAAASAADSSAATESNGHKNTHEQIVNLLRKAPSHVYTPMEVSKALSIGASFAALTLGMLAKKNLAEKVESGKYRAVFS
jgi:hypothetical protein